MMLTETTDPDLTPARSFAVAALDPQVAAELRVRDDAHRAPRSLVDDEGGNPLRCCLRLSGPGEHLLLASYAPLRRWAAARGVDPGGYDEVGPVFLHPERCEGPRGDGWPEELRGQPRVLRAYDAGGSIVGGRLVTADEDPEAALAEVFDDPRVAVVHARALVAGCFTFAVARRPD